MSGLGPCCCCWQISKVANFANFASATIFPTAGNLPPCWNGRSAAGNITIYRKHNKPAFGPLGDSLNDFDPPTAA